MMSKTDKAFSFAMVHSTKRNKKQQQTTPQTYTHLSQSNTLNH